MSSIAGKGVDRLTLNLWLDRLLDVAFSPALWLAALLAFSYSTLFTLWRGAGWRSWGRDLLAGLVGFGAGQIAGMGLGSAWLRVGDVQLLWGTLGAVIALIVGAARQART